MKGTHTVWVDPNVACDFCSGKRKDQFMVHPQMNKYIKEHKLKRVSMTMVFGHEEKKL